MNADRLHFSDGTPTNVWTCRQCGAWFAIEAYKGCGPHGKDEARFRAQECCQPRTCQDCPAVLPKRYASVCDSCQERRSAAREQDLFAKAIKVDPSTYDDPVFWSTDEMFQDAVAFQEHWECVAEAGDERPAYVWCAKRVEFKPSVAWMLDKELEHHYDDAGDRILPAEYVRLEKMVADWAEEQCLYSWGADLKRYLLLDWEEKTDQPIVAEAPL